MLNLLFPDRTAIRRTREAWLKGWLKAFSRPRFCMDFIATGFESGTEAEVEV
jgi:hypothetical protein